VSSYLENLSDLERQEFLATAHVFPDDIKKLGSSECTVNAYSVEMGDPDRGETVPLYTHPASANAPDDAKYVRAALHLNTGSTQTPRQLCEVKQCLKSRLSVSKSLMVTPSLSVQPCWTSGSCLYRVALPT
jgi:hypothetical protein